MKEFQGKALRWSWQAGVVELTLDHAPLNEIGTVLIADRSGLLKRFRRWRRIRARV